MDKSTYYLIIIPIFLAIRIVLGLVTESIASEKGHSGGFWLGFTRGIRGINRAMTLSDEYEMMRGRDREISSAYEEWNCPKCGKRNIAMEKRCTCGYLKQNSDAIPKKNEWQCPDCGRIMAMYVTTCICGTSLDSYKEMQAKARKENHSKE